MPLLIAKIEKSERRILFTPDRSLRDILDATDIRVRSRCRGTGACGCCRVQIEAGKVNEPTPNEHTHMGSARLDQGIRLACQVMPKDDLRIVVLEPAPKSNWRSLFEEEEEVWRIKRYPTLRELPPEVEHPYGVAVDLGTTRISLSLLDLSSGQRLAGRYGLNPQMSFGSDIMTRLVAASESQTQAQTMRQQAIEAIGEAMLDIATREGINLQRVTRLTLVGNTAMLALLSGRNYGMLLQPSRWMSPVDCLPLDTESWAVSWDIYPRAGIEVIPPLAGFVGSDLLAGVLATHLTENETCGLFIDFGTNSEIALWDGQTLWVTSAAGGPAFEDSGISCGMSAEPGAVYRVSLENGVLDFAVIAGGKARGLCGSGLIDLITNLMKSGKLGKTGRFTPDVPGECFKLVEGEQSLFLTKGDVDVFQRAKAAIGAGINILLAKAGMGHRDLHRICVGGAFGRFLNVANAQDVGLLPDIQPDLVELCGNTALAGCEWVLLSSEATKNLETLTEQAKIVNLAQCDDFEDIFFESLYLEPMGGISL